ncbi:sensor histidine kinase [Neotamlana nanhaiensis]|uniref:sensor histidine kinase n=1 Tax=Neotamlana nanhaiensis TaxID=1382798 RepID=UPI00069C77FA|nr:histidine kinase [Tamlana nanhaiensis]
MKKILLILIILAPLGLLVVNTSSESLVTNVENDSLYNQNTNLNWEYIKDNVFGNQLITRKTVARKINGPILFTLNNASKNDSLALTEILLELKEVIPNKTIDYFKSYTKTSFSEFIANPTKTELNGYSRHNIISSTLKLNFYTDDYINKKGSSYETLDLYFSFKNTTSTKERTKYLQSEILKTICFLHKKPDENLFLNLKYPTDALFNEPTYNVLNKEFTAIDKFLVNKLYSNNFQDEFSNYIYSTYPWRYANIYLNPRKTQLLTFTCIGLFCIVLFTLAFNFFGKNDTSFLGYFFALTIIFLGLIIINGYYNYFVDIEKPGISTQNIVLLIVYILGFSFVNASILFVIERKLKIISLSFSYQFLLKLLFTFTIIQLPIIIGFFINNLQLDVFISNYTPLFFISIVLTLGRGLLMYLNHFSKTLIQQKDLELSQLKALNAKNELKSLHAHIDPHFLYNALNSIASLMHESVNKAEDMIISLSDLFRYSINRKGKKMSTIEDEVLMVENYLRIEKIRFGDRLKFTFNVDENLLEKQIPMYILQPLIENAVKHGINKLETPGEINLTIQQRSNNLVITINDNGADFPTDLYGGYGLQSVYDLLRLSYGNKASINWTNAPKQITIIMPTTI